MLPVLMYHGLHDDDAPLLEPVYSVRPSHFEAQLEWLRAQGYRTPTLAAAVAAPVPGDVLITFDDGDASNLEVAVPLLRRYGFRGEFFVTSDFVGRPGYLAPAQLRELVEAGMGVHAHGRSHRFLADLDDAELDAELRDSKAALESLTGRPVDALALPGGRGGARAARHARALGYRHVFGSRPGVNRRPPADGCIERIAITRDLPLARFADRVRWQGLAPRVQRARHAVLEWPKRLLGNGRYVRLREALLR